MEGRSFFEPQAGDEAIAEAAADQSAATAGLCSIDDELWLLGGSNDRLVSDMERGGNGGQADFVCTRTVLKP